MALSKRTQLEQAAGREAIRRAVAEELLAKGMRELTRRFPAAFPVAALDWNSSEWVITVRVACANGDPMSFTAPFAGFPNDRLIAEIALVV